MQFTSVIPFMLLCTTVVAAPHARHDAVTSPGKKHQCHRGAHIISTRGHSFDNTTTYESLGGLTDLLADIEAAMKHSTARRVHYPNTSPDLPHGVARGTKVLTRMIEDYVADCPNGHIVLLGYSEGAMVTMNTLCGTTSEGYNYTAPLAKAYKKNIVAAVVYGDLTRAVDQPYNLGTCKTYGTRKRLEPSLCDPYKDMIQSYCDFGDPYCCNGGTDYHVHYSYPRLYDTNATDFVVSQWKADVNPRD